jgi:CRISPR-associated exonuclease Cas4
MTCAILILVLMFGLLLALAAQMLRASLATAGVRTVALDVETAEISNRTLFSERYGLVGRPDRIIRVGDRLMPEEWKSSKRVQPWHEAQLGVYFLLIEESYGTRPPYGVIVTEDGERHRVENSEELRAWVLDTADRIRAARAFVAEEIPVNPKPWQCRACGQRSRCRQAL